MFNEQLADLQHELPQFNVIILQMLELREYVVQFLLRSSTISTTKLADDQDYAASCCDDSGDASEDGIESHALQDEPGQTRSSQRETEHHRRPWDGIHPTRPIQKRCHQRQNERDEEEHICRLRVPARDVCKHDGLSS